MAVVPSLTPRPDRPTPSAAPCPREASAKSPSPVSPGSARHLPASSPFWVSASSPHSCAAASAPSNQSAASRAAPIGPRSPTAANPRKCAAIGLREGSHAEALGSSDHTAATARRFCSKPPRDPTGISARRLFVRTARHRCPRAFFYGSNFTGRHAVPAFLSMPRALRSLPRRALAPAATPPDFASCVSKPITPRLPQKNPRSALRISPSILRNALKTSANLPLSNCSITGGDTDLQPQRYPAPPASLRQHAGAVAGGCLRKGMSEGPKAG